MSWQHPVFCDPEPALIMLNVPDTLALFSVLQYCRAGDYPSGQQRDASNH